MAVTLYQEINAKITGRLALLSEAEADLLAQVVDIPGDHVEIGTLWGGTAILAALVKERKNRRGHVYTIDYMQGGYWQTGDPGCKNAVPTPTAILDNLCKFGIAHRVSVIKWSSYPWPLPERIRPASVLIDGGHDYSSVFHDWISVKALAPRFVCFHDVGKTHPDVLQVVNGIVEHDPSYKRAETAGSLAVYEAIR